MDYWGQTAFSGRDWRILCRVGAGGSAVEVGNLYHEVELRRYGKWMVLGFLIAGYGLGHRSPGSVNCSILQR